jgi:hypothetical protein
VCIRGYHALDDLVLVYWAEQGVHREADDLLPDLLGDGSAVGAAEVFVGRLLVQGHWIVDGGGDTGLAQMRLQSAAVMGEYRVLSEDRRAVFIWPRQRAYGISHGYT